MDQDLWTAVEEYYSDFLMPEDAALSGALKSSAAAGLPSINVSPPQGKFLHLIARLHGAKAILEVGTLGGYSTIWLARALAPGGRLTSLEYEPLHVETARKNIAAAGLSEIVEVIPGRAAESMAKLAAEKRGPFDMIFIDADKPGTADYFAWAMKLSRRGTLIVVDNVVRKGAVIDAASDDAAVQGIRRFCAALAAEKRVDAAAIQTVGTKGYDGMVFAIVNEGAEGSA